MTHRRQDRSYKVGALQLEDLQIATDTSLLDLQAMSLRHGPGFMLPSTLALRYQYPPRPSEPMPLVDSASPSAESHSVWRLRNAGAVKTAGDLPAVQVERHGSSLRPAVYSSLRRAHRRLLPGENGTDADVEVKEEFRSGAGNVSSLRHQTHAAFYP